MSTSTDPIAVPDDARALHREPVPPPPSAAFFAGNPAVVGVPVFVAGSVALALNLMNYVPSVGAPIPVIFSATGLGLLLATVWAAVVGQTIVASIFGVFAGFWLSYAALVLGLTHNWFAIAPADVMHTQAAFLVVWLSIIVLLTLGTLRLPSAYTLLLVLIDVALVFVLIGTVNAEPNATKIGGWLALCFAAVGAYLFVDVTNQACGGKPLPLGRPILR